MTAVGVVILAWNSRRVLGPCLESVFSMRGIRADVVVVDNGSTDGTVASLDTFSVPEPHALQVMSLPGNVGTTKSRNLALKELLARHHEFICVLDSDTVVNEAAVEFLVGELRRHPEFGIVGPALVGRNGELQPSARPFPTMMEKIRAILRWRRGDRADVTSVDGSDATPREVDYLMSAFWLVRADVFIRAGILDEAIFYAPEDAEFCLRVWRSGYRIGYCPTVSIVHEWQRLSRRSFFSRINFEHLLGLAHLFWKYRYLLSSRGLRNPSSWSTFAAFKRMDDRDGRIPSDAELSALRRTLLSMLEDILAAAASCGAAVQLGGGSALGAVRHGGFIPWDDDLDVNLPRSDWPSLRAGILKMFPGRYAIYEPGAPSEYAFAFPRIRRIGTCVRTRDDLVSPTSCCGATVDLFLMDNTPDNRLLRALHGIGSLGLGFAYSCRKAFAEREWQRKVGLFSGVFRLKRLMGCMIAFMSLGRWTRIWDAWNGLCRNADSAFVTVGVGRRHYFGELAGRSSVFPSSVRKFEGLQCPVASDVESYMKRLYGDGYMSLPPPDRREHHLFYGPFEPTPGEDVQ